MRFVLDEDVDVQLVGSFLRQRGHECWSVVDAGLGGADDDAVAIYADDRDAVLITHDAGATRRRRRFTFGRHVFLRCHQLDHARFERIHPFTDGNGRVGRLLANWSLVQTDYPPMIMRYQQRDRYLRSLERADQRNLTGLVELFARAVSESINRFILPRLAGDARVVPLRALAEGSP